MQKLNVLDLFSGCGGFTEGFLKTKKFNFLAHIEWEKPMVNTLRENLKVRWGYQEDKAKETVIRFDLQKIEELLHGNWSEESKKEYGSDNAELVMTNGLDGVIGNNKVDIIIGGPPCQAYSLAGRAQDANSMKDDYRNYLFESFVALVNYYQPKVFVFENVPGILSAKPGDKLVIERIIEAFEEIGYEIRDKNKIKQAIYSSMYYNVPQDRRRVIIFGVKKDGNYKLEDFYTALDNEKSKDIKTVKDAIYDLPKFEPLEKSYKLKNKNISHHLIGDLSLEHHEARYHNLRDINVFKKWLENNMNYCSSEEKLNFYYQVSGKKTNHNKYRNLEWDKPSPTIVSHLYKDGLMFIHPDVQQARSITVLEAALLQSFPKDYKFVGSIGYCFKMIGNAVPVLLAESIANASYEVLEMKKEKKVLNVLVACEESQRVCQEFRALGHNAFSCDLLPCSGGHPEWHFQYDVLEIIKNKGGELENGESIFIDGKWDLMVAHPPCTFLSVSGAKWYYHPDDKHLPTKDRRPHPRFPNRAKDRDEAAEFFLALMNADIEHIALENPVGIMNTQYRKPDQIVQPYFFGDEASKATCLWLKNLSPLVPTKMVGRGEFIELSSGKRLPKWYSDALTNSKSAAERRTLRSKTFPGFAKALAKQWSDEVLK